MYDLVIIFTYHILENTLGLSSVCKRRFEYIVDLKLPLGTVPRGKVGSQSLIFQT